MADQHTELEELREELHKLERRVGYLEHRVEPVPRLEPAPVLTTGPTPAPPRDFAFPGAIRTAGRALLGLAGGFLLRALAQSNVAPTLLVVVVAMVYGFVWLFVAPRLRRDDRIAGTAYSITAALILIPLFWEATVRFKVLPPLATSLILVGYVLLSFMLPWSGPTMTTISTLAALGAAIALMVQTGDLVPFAAALLAMAAVSHRGKVGPAAALAADFGVWLVLYIATRPGGVPAGYQSISPIASLTLCFALIFIHAATIVRRTVLDSQTITVFEIVQLLIAFVLSAGGALVITDTKAAPAIGSLCAIGAALCYFTAFQRFSGSLRRNHHVYLSWGALLGLVACYLILPESLLMWTWSAAAIMARLAGIRVHAAIYLLAAALISMPPSTMALWVIATAAVCIAIPRSNPWANLIPAAIATLAICTLVVHLAAPSPQILPTARTLVICAAALALALVGSRTGRAELVWISYTAVGLGALKLFAEDFRQSPPAALAVSLLCYGVLLILVPKLRPRADGSALAGGGGGT